MAGRGRNGTAPPRVSKSSGRQGTAKKKADPYDPRHMDDDPYRDLRIQDDEQNSPENEEYIWPEFDEEDEDRV